MRQEVVDWLAVKAGELQVDREALQLAVRYLDSFLEAKGADSFLARSSTGRQTGAEGALPQVQEGSLILQSPPRCPKPVRDKLRRLAATCLFVASKLVHNPRSCPMPERFADAAKANSFSYQQMLFAEKTLLRTLDHALLHPTPCEFVRAYANASKSSIPQSKFFTVKEMALCVSDISHLPFSLIVDFAPSVIAAASLTIASGASVGLRTAADAWRRLEPLTHFTGFSTGQVVQACHDLLQSMKELKGLSHLAMSRSPYLDVLCSALPDEHHHSGPASAQNA